MRYIRVKLNTENYRRRRKETLENLARMSFQSEKNKKTGIPGADESIRKKSDPLCTSDDPQLSTQSEGEEPYRHVVVTLKIT